MARPARFTDDDLLDAAAVALGEVGPGLTVADVGRAAGAPTGSIYHRFASRDELLARLWIRSIQRFHVGLLAAFETDDPDAAVVAAATHVPRYCREHPRDALAMTLHRQSRLVETCPEDLRETVAHVNDDIEAATRALVRRRYGRVTARRTEVVRIATRLCPYGMVRPFVGGPVPDLLDDAVAASALAIAALPDA